ncbi:MAG: M23 family metallopeptidase [Proteobacteria bacterium]|nr:M23 family metallopeptidase [Pseudomonadota bacterium]
MRKILLPTVALFAIFIAGCIISSSGSNSSGVYNSPAAEEKIQVAFHDIPYQTEKYLRIGYMLKTWEYEKDSLELQQIKVLDKDTGEELLTINKENIPKIYKSPLTPNPYAVEDTLTNYYLSIQIPIPLGKTPPKTVYHRLTLKNTTDNSELAIEGGVFSPRTNEVPIIIASPLKGENLSFFNHSTMGYHFYVTMFLNGSIVTPERYAFDSAEFNDDFTATHNGDPKVNESYFNYKKTVYAVANGKVVQIQDGLPENKGNLMDIKNFDQADQLGGNFLIQDIGDGRYAYYYHCVPGSFLVKTGNMVKEGDPVALLGNSGNSTEPHLHFHIADGPNPWASNGLPFVLKEYIKTGDAAKYYEKGDSNTILSPESYETVTNAMMEFTTVLKVE